MRTGTLRIGPQTITAWIVETPAEASLGLSQIDYLLPTQGMVFPASVVGPTPTFVFSSNKVPLDVVWVKNGVVVSMAPMVPAGTPVGLQYGYGTVDYGVELPAGFINQWAIKPGNPAVLKA